MVFCFNAYCFYWFDFKVIYSSTLEVIQDAGHMVMVESPLR